MAPEVFGLPGTLIGLVGLGVDGGLGAAWASIETIEVRASKPIKNSFFIFVPFALLNYFTLTFNGLTGIGLVTGEICGLLFVANGPAGVKAWALAVNVIVSAIALSRSAFFM